MSDIIKIGVYEFVPTGVPDTYVCKDIVLVVRFDKFGRNCWSKSTCKAELEEWFYGRASADIKRQYYIDLPEVEEVFSQKMLSLHRRTSSLTSKQFPIFKDSDERIKIFDDKPMRWWTKSAKCSDAPYDANVWLVHGVGTIGNDDAATNAGIVPVLRKKKTKTIKKRVGDFTVRDLTKICENVGCCSKCPLGDEWDLCSIKHRLDATNIDKVIEIEEAE